MQYMLLLLIAGLGFIFIGYYYSNSSDEKIRRTILERSKLLAIPADNKLVEESIILWRKRYKVITYCGLLIIGIGVVLTILEKVLN